MAAQQQQRRPGRHTILLYQPSQDPLTRTYVDHESTEAAVDAICRMFEMRLKEQHPDESQITYEVADLFRYVDQMYDMACLVFSPENNTYVPRNKDWIKEQVYQHLKRLASQDA